MKKYTKKKSGPNQAGPKYRTPDHFKQSVKFEELKGQKFSGFKKSPGVKFNPARFKIQHKG